MKTAAWVVSAQVLNWMLQGHIRKEVATHLGLSIHTAAEYISELYKRFGVNSQTSLVRRFLVADGVLSPLTIRQTGTWRTGTAYSTYKKHPLRCGAFTHSQLANGSYHDRSSRHRPPPPWMGGMTAMRVSYRKDPAHPKGKIQPTQKTMKMGSTTHGIPLTRPRIFLGLPLNQAPPRSSPFPLISDNPKHPANEDHSRSIDRHLSSRCR